ncbi:hypothetical protein AAHE18_02G132900 [Arachis hypogaea]
MICISFSNFLLMSRLIPSSDSCPSRPNIWFSNVSGTPTPSCVMQQRYRMAKTTKKWLQSCHPLPTTNLELRRSQYGTGFLTLSLLFLLLWRLENYFDGRIKNSLHILYSKADIIRDVILSNLWNFYRCREHICICCVFEIHSM